MRTHILPPATPIRVTGETAGTPAVHSTLDEPRVNYSLRREVAFVVAGSLAGAMLMHASQIYATTIGGNDYLRLLLVIARIVGSGEPLAGLVLHMLVATSIGIVAGVVLYRVFGISLSRIRNGVAYGIIVGLTVLVAFAIPVSMAIIDPAAAGLAADMPSMAATQLDAAVVLTDSAISHIIWGLTVGIIASALTRRFGANYRCHRCDIEFSKRATYAQHVARMHGSGSPLLRRILILGGGYAGVGVLRRLQREFEDSVDTGITIVSEDNFFLSTPLLAEMATGHVEPRHISTPIRTFCRRARYYHASVESIDLDSRTATIRRRMDGKAVEMNYDHLVLALGGETNYYGNKSVEENALTIKTLEDALSLRNRLIMMLESADQEDDVDAQSRMATFVIVGGGFSGVETAGAIQDFVTESAERYYRNIEPGAIRVILVSSGRILPEIGDLGEYAEKAMARSGIEILRGVKLASVEPDSATLSDGTVIPCMTTVWAGGVKASPVIASLDAEHGSGGRVMVNEWLQLAGHPEVHALGDCAHLIDSRTDRPYPPTAQNAIRQASVAAHNVTAALKGGRAPRRFDYESAGSMAMIGKRDGVALLFGIRLKGVLAWLLWRNYYLSRLPSAEKRLRVAIDWLVDLYVPSDVTRLGNILDKRAGSD